MLHYALVLLREKVSLASFSEFLENIGVLIHKVYRDINSISRHRSRLDNNPRSVVPEYGNGTAALVDFGSYFREIVPNLCEIHGKVGIL